ncbi:ATP-binding protein [Streptomyces sp. Ru71]|uniref:ATP-binding protein n=1 Tax=Streptomyces sp. Ru71 TaxID=2080746 RepID=UPI000CDE0811|nr:ATP-binding protein [Streptomyces sp. Ru71]POX48175.1 ATP-binding protein [Streptomyces sp. Ru71]
MTAELVLTAGTAHKDAERLGYDWPIPHIPEAVALVRRRVGSLLKEWDVGADSVDEVLLVVSELVTNAVLHALPPATLTLSCTVSACGRRVRVEVRDHGAAEVIGEPADDEHGRGCGIVIALAAACGAYTDASGCVRWAELDCPPQ